MVLYFLGNKEVPSNCLWAGGGVNGSPPERLHNSGTHSLLHEDTFQRHAQRWHVLIFRRFHKTIFLSHSALWTGKTSSPFIHKLSFLFSALELLSEVVQNCSLSEADIEQQRSVVLRELEEVEGNLQEVCLDLLHASAFQGTPLGHTVLGPSDNARSEKRACLVYLN